MNDDGRPRRARGIKTITLVGRLGADPEKRFTQDGREYSTFRVAVNDNRRGPDRQWTEHTDWFRVTAWGRTAEMANQYLNRGSRVYVSGRFRSSEWTGNDGQTRTSLEVSASDVVNLTSGSPASSEGPPVRPAARPAGGAVESWEQAADQPTGQRPASGEKEIDIDDLPF